MSYTVRAPLAISLISLIDFDPRLDVSLPPPHHMLRMQSISPSPRLWDLRFAVSFGRPTCRLGLTFRRSTP
jgi:hypothetical protein